MTLQYVLDEHLRGVLWEAISRRNSFVPTPLDVLRAGDPPDLPLGTLDPDLLSWAEREGRILVTGDRRTMPGFFRQHIASGRSSPGVFILVRRAEIVAVVDFLAIASTASNPEEWINQIQYIP